MGCIRLTNVSDEFDCVMLRIPGLCMFHEEGRGVLEFAVFCMHAKSSAGQHGVILTFSISNSTMYYSIYSTAHHVVLQIKNGI